MRAQFRVSVLCALVVFVAMPRDAHAADALRSPWDALPTNRVVRPDSDCPAPPALPADIQTSSYYSDSAHSIVDPERKRAYDEAVRPLHDATGAVEKMADRYRADGDAADAVCVATWLDSFAKTGVLTGTMATNQDTYVQGWIVGAFAIVWLKVRVEPAIDAGERGRIADWLATVAASNDRYYDRRATKGDGRNNHRYWAGLTSMAAGIAADRQYLFDWGVASFNIGASQITPDGTLPLEMARAGRALHYHLFAAAPLVIMAELASANGVDLYGADDGALARLVRRAVSGIDDPSFFTTHAGIEQEPVKLHADDIAWAAPFARRYPDAQLTALLDRLSSRSVLYIGGLPPP